MDEIFDKIKVTFEEVKEREAEVARREKALRVEETGVRSKANALDEARSEFERKLAALEKEKNMMAKTTVTAEDIVQINVQGEKFLTLRGTLTQFPETRLAYMFNGRWKDKLIKDPAGNVFLDVSPSLFRLLLDYLTTRRLAGTNNIPFPNVDANQLPQFKLMLKYFEVEAAIYSRISCFSQYLRSAFISLNSEACVATNMADSMGYVLGQDVYRNEIVHFVLEIEKVEESWMFFGVMCETGTGKNVVNDCSFNGNPDAFGWADKGGFWKAGARQGKNTSTIPSDVLQKGTTVEMILDSCARPSKLSIKILPGGHVQDFTDLPSGQAWRLHINLVSNGDSVRLIKAERSPGVN